MSIFLVCSPSARSFTTVKRDFHFCVQILQLRSPRCVFFSKTNEIWPNSSRDFSLDHRASSEKRNKLLWPKGESVEREKARQTDFQNDVSRPSSNIFLSRRAASKSRLPLIQHNPLLYKRRYLFSSIYQRWRISNCKESIEIYVRYLVFFSFFYFRRSRR